MTALKGGGVSRSFAVPFGYLSALLFPGIGVHRSGVDRIRPQPVGSPSFSLNFHPLYVLNWISVKHRKGRS